MRPNECASSLTRQVNLFKPLAATMGQPSPPRWGNPTYLDGCHHSHVHSEATRWLQHAVLLLLFLSLPHSSPVALWLTLPRPRCLPLADWADNPHTIHTESTQPTIADGFAVQVRATVYTGAMQHVLHVPPPASVPPPSSPPYALHAFCRSSLSTSLPPHTSAGILFAGHVNDPSCLEICI